jgi:hypothetical protein
MSEGAECPTCGREDFQNYKGLNYHHSEVHGTPLIRDSDIVAAIETVNERETASAISGQATVRDVRGVLADQETPAPDRTTLARYIRRLEETGRVESGRSVVFGSHGEVKTLAVAGGGRDE